MTDNNAIQLISDPLLSTHYVESSDPGLFAKLAQKYPYFQPLRYIKAKVQYQSEGFADDLLSGAYPYIGNWILFYDFVKGNQPDISTHNSYSSVTDDEYIELSLTAQATETAPYEIEIVEYNITETDATEPEAIEAEEIAVTFNEEPVSEPIEEPITYNILDTVQDTPAQEQLTNEEELMHNTTTNEEPLFTPVFAEDYFMQQGIKVPGDIPDNVPEFVTEEMAREKALMVMMSFKDWLLHFKNSAEKQKEELEDQRAVKTMWQKEKLAAALQEENEEIPENVFEMAVNSITSEEGLASESLAEIYLKQQKYEKAIEMYRKLSLRNPEKNAYFAQKIKDILKEKEL